MKILNNKQSVLKDPQNNLTTSNRTEHEMFQTDASVQHNLFNILKFHDSYTSKNKCY